MARHVRPATYTEQPGASATEVLHSSRDDSMTEGEKTYRDAFVREYIKDFNGTKAMVRMGYVQKNPGQRASGLLREPYVANRLYELVRQLQPTDVVQRGQVMARMWEEANDDFNPSMVRVAALAHIGKMLGMFKEERDDSNLQPAGVMLVPCMAIAEWEQSAAVAQDILKRQASGSYPPPPPPIPAATGNN